MAGWRRLTTGGLVIALASSATACRPAEEGMETLPESPAEELLNRAIAYHDSDAAWSTFVGTLEFEELRPDGIARRVDVALDVPGAGMTHRGQMDGREVVREVGADVCRATLAGEEATEAEAVDLGLTCDRLERTRNYYHFLWGLPMKLKDPGTILDPEVERATFAGVDVDQLRVTYDPEVGGDTWYFYFDTTTARLVGYRFYHDESQNDGEYITLDGERAVDGMRIPANRRWYVNADDRFLGEDRLIGLAEAGP